MGTMNSLHVHGGAQQLLPSSPAAGAGIVGPLSSAPLLFSPTSNHHRAAAFAIGVVRHRAAAAAPAQERRQRQQQRQCLRRGPYAAPWDCCGYAPATAAHAPVPWTSRRNRRIRSCCRSGFLTALWATDEANTGDGGDEKKKGEEESVLPSDVTKTDSSSSSSRGEERLDMMSEIASEDLFDDLNFDDDFLLLDAGDLDLADDDDDDDGVDLEEILAQMEEGDFLVLAGDDDDGGEGRDGEGKEYIVASAELDFGDLNLSLSIGVDSSEGDDGQGEDDDDELDDETLLELLGMDDDVDPDDLMELERLLEQKRKIDDALDLRRILGPRREVEVPTKAKEEEEEEEEDAEEGTDGTVASRPREGGGSLGESGTGGRGGPADTASPAGLGMGGGAPSELERALLQGVVPADAGVGSGSLPGDFGFDPLELSTRDYFKRTQRFLLGLLPQGPDMEEGNKDDENTANNKREEMEYDGSALPPGWRPSDQETRPPALILRDYREAEIRHGRLAMLAALFWPLQEIVDRLFIPSSFGRTTVIYGGPTLPFLPLLMTAIMLLLGYLDIYAAAVKDEDAGEAFLPGECFWDPLRILDGATDSTKRNMQQRELNNGRAAMVAVAMYVLEEGWTHRPLITLPYNEFLFEPAYTVPVVQAWLDRQFQSPSPALTFPEVGSVDFVETLKEVLEEEGALQQQMGAEGLLDAAANAASDAASSGLEAAAGSSAQQQTNNIFPDNLLQ